MDALSEMLKVVRLRGAMYFNAEFSAPWAVKSPPVRVSMPIIAPGAERLINYHFVTSGRAYVQVAGHAAVPLAAGDVVALPHGDAHVLGNGIASTIVDAAETLSGPIGRNLGVRRLGGGGEPTRFTAPGWPRVVYLAVLLSHTVLAAVVAPLALVTLVMGFNAYHNRHARLARWTLPIWLYVSLTGVVVYWMLYHLYPPA